MSKYKLTKTAKGKKFLYQVWDNKGNLVSDRLSTRDYVACTYNGAFYFGRLDLIGKGDHGRHVRMCQKEGTGPLDLAYLS